MAEKWPKPWPSAKGNLGATDDGKGTGVRFEVMDEIHKPQESAPGKLLTLQLLHILGEERHEVRFGYYLYNADKQRWYWSRFSAMAPLEDFEALAATAKRRWKDVWPKGVEIIPVDLEAIARDHGRKSWGNRWGSR